jgi:hypothetical protein
LLHSLTKRNPTIADVATWQPIMVLCIVAKASPANCPGNAQYWKEEGEMCSS